MPKPKGYPLKAIRLSRDLVRFEFRYDGKQIRRECRMDALVALLMGGEAEETNLAFGAEPITLKDFVDRKYLPFSAKPRLKNPVSYTGEFNLAKALCKDLGSRYLHEIRAKDAEACKERWLKEALVNSTIKKRLNGLRRIMAYAESVGLIKANLIRPVLGLPVGDRSDIWLKLPEIDHLISKCDPSIKHLVEYLVLTGARVNEALDFRLGDVRNGKLYVPTQKQGRAARERMRELDVASLGPRFADLLTRLKPHPLSGFYFHATLREPNKSTAMSDSYAGRRFTEARNAAGLDHIHMHDLRGTFAVHRAMVVTNFRQLQAELGHSNPASMQAYLDRARQFDPKESIFYVPPVPAESK
ncbi:MAG: tyrosine-type recombinase/integrase [Elusimicrobiota bacterium]